MHIVDRFMELSCDPATTPAVSAASEPKPVPQHDQDEDEMLSPRSLDVLPLNAR